MNKRKILLYLLLIFSVNINAQKFVNDFLNIGVGARAHGMSGAVVAGGQDGTAAIWNPAGLSSLSSSLQVNAMHAEWFAGVANYDYGSIVKRFNEEKKSYGSLSVIRMGVDDIPNTLQLIGPDGSVNYDDITSFSAVSYGIFLSHGRQIFTKSWRIGGSIKVINNSLGPFANSWGIGADLGLLFAKPKYTLALMAKDITTTYNSWSFNFTESDKAILAATGNDIPVSSTEVSYPAAILGVAFHNDRSNYTSLFQYTIEANLGISSDGFAAGIGSEKFNLDPAFGFEVGFKNIVFLRGGAGNVQRLFDEFGSDTRTVQIEPNVGLGLKLGRIKIDYALTNLGTLNEENGALYSNIFSLALDFYPRS